jgi:hypothetical protein
MTRLDDGEGRPEATITTGPRADADADAAPMDVLGALLEQQAKVARAEVALAAARERLAVLADRYGQLGGVPPVDGEAWTALGSPQRERCGRAVPDGGPSVRARILAALTGRPGEVLTPAQLAALVGARSRDTVRNALLVLAEKGRIEKVGPGQYRCPVELTS